MFAREPFVEEAALGRGLGGGEGSVGSADGDLVCGLRGGGFAGGRRGVCEEDVVEGWD